MVRRASPNPNRLNIDTDMRLILAPRSHKTFSNMELPIMHGIVKNVGSSSFYGSFSLQDGITLLSEVYCLKVR